eukprot:6492781-Amphidinium_carterae.1
MRMIVKPAMALLGELNHCTVVTYDGWAVHFSIKPSTITPFGTNASSAWVHTSSRSKYIARRAICTRNCCDPFATTLHVAEYTIAKNARQQQVRSTEA